MVNYKYIDKNIYKVGNSYRIRVGNSSFYQPTIKKARKMRTLMKASHKRGKIW